MKLSKKIKELRAKIEDEKIKEELTTLISHALDLETEIEISEKEIAKLKNKEFTASFDEPKKPENKIKYISGPVEVKITDGNEEIKVDFRITSGVGKAKGSFVFSGISQTKPEKETGKIYRRHEINGKEIFVIYKR